MRICIIYDCLFPWTIGGAERWYRCLAERCAAAGHEVTYLTMKQWDADNAPNLPGVKVIAVAPRMALYRDGKRRIAPPLVFGFGVFLHLLYRGRRYDRLCTASFPFFSLLAAGFLRPFCGYSLFVDWIEVWTKDYWRGYLGRLGWVGWSVQRLCASFRQRAYSFSEMHAARFAQLFGRSDVQVLPGFFPGGGEGKTMPATQPPTVIYAGRMIPEKRVPLLVEALAVCMRRHPTMLASLYGRGPDSAHVAARITALGLQDRISMPGFVEQDEIDRAMAGATALAQPSEREGYGIVVVESTARGVPVVVVRAPDNAAVELVEDGLNGYIAENDCPEVIADAILRCVEGGESLRASTRSWYEANARRVSIDTSADLVLGDLAGR